jgi:Flp pilus assembly protein TadG
VPRSKRAGLVGRARPDAGLREERGAAAVEFAFVVPVLLVLLFAIIQSTQALQADARLSAAAREGARVMALTSNPAQARTAVQGAAAGLDIPAGQIEVTPDACVSTDVTATVTVTVTYRFPYAFGFFDQTGVDLTGTAVMRCGG